LHIIPGNFSRPRASRETLFENTRRFPSTTSSLFGETICRIPSDGSEESRQILSVPNWEMHKRNEPKRKRNPDDDADDDESGNNEDWLTSSSSKSEELQHSQISKMKSVW
jgi:hypothetical protein